MDLNSGDPNMQWTVLMMRRVIKTFYNWPAGPWSGSTFYPFFPVTSKFWVRLDGVLFGRTLKRLEKNGSLEYMLKDYIVHSPQKENGQTGLINYMKLIFTLGSYAVRTCRYALEKKG